MSVSDPGSTVNRTINGPASVKAAIVGTIAEWSDRLVEVSRAIHADPELGFTEYRAAALVAGVLHQAGFTTTVGAYGLDTAVEAVAGTGDLTVTLCAEYDALPDIGHACGHNIIATAGLGAAIALASVADELGIRVKLLGTPAEEHGGGKVLMLRAGAWEDATISLMVHGMSGTDVSCQDLTEQALDRFEVTYEGVAAHAAAAPHHGVNAADAATVALVGIGLLRQQLADTVRCNAFIAEAGEATNIIPWKSVVRVEVRAFDLEVMLDAKRRILACFEAGAMASGCTWRHQASQPRYANLVQDPLLATAWDANLEALGRRVDRRPGSGGGSTDMGNVSQAVPAIHPGIAVLGSDSALHTIDFAADAGTPAAERAALDGATAMAWTVADVALDAAARATFLERQARRLPGATKRSPGAAHDS